LSLNKIWDKKTKTLSVSKNNIGYQLKIGEDFWFSLSDVHKTGVLKHELLHCAFFHLTMADDFKDKKLFNVAADIEINQYIKDSSLPEGVLRLDSFPEITLPPKAGTKVYYELLQQAKDEGKSPTLDDLLNTVGGDMSADGLMSPDHESWEEFQNISEADKKLIEAQTKHVLNEFADAVKSRGHIPAEIKSILDRINYTEPPKFDWRGYLRRFAGKSVTVYTKKLRKKFNKRFEDNPGLKIKQRKHVLVAIDT
jgi:predicted metal-dependent peptidase